MRLCHYMVVHVVVVLVVNVQMFMRDGLVLVAMTVLLQEQDKHSTDHERCAGEIRPAGKFAKHHD